jgi:hypothetical protein
MRREAAHAQILAFAFPVKFIEAFALSQAASSTCASQRQLESGASRHYICIYVMIGMPMASVVTINRPEVVALIEEAATKLTHGNKTEAVALAVRRLLDEDARAGSLFGAHRGSVRIRNGVDLIAPALDVEPDAGTGRELER